MNKLILFALSAVISVLFIGCYGTSCDVSNGNAGIIVSNVDSLNDPCFTPKKEKFYVTTDSAYKAQFSVTCGKTLPVIDFSKHSLLGFHTTGSGCEIGFVREVKADHANKKLIYNVDVFRCGNCKMAVSSRNYVLIPKVAEGYTVEFTTKETASLSR